VVYLERNYLFDLYSDFPKGFNLKTRKDPDKSSKQLYDDVKEIFFTRKQLDCLKLHIIENKCQNFGKGDFYTLFIDGGKYKLSTDYIGASVHWAQKAGLSDAEIVEYLKVSRTIGGHIVFPRGKKITVNQVRGGEKSYYDRFDLTLLAIKKWYSNEFDLKINDVIEIYKDWFSLFGTFDKFIAFFKLEDFIHKGSIIDLIHSDLGEGVIRTLNEEKIEIPCQKEGYKRYFNNSNLIIKRRTEKLSKSN